MESEVVRLKREQMLRDGYCVIEEVVPEQFLEELHAETESWIADHEEPDDLVYQGQHIVVHRDDNPLIDRLLCWEPAYAAARDLGFGDFAPHGAIITLTKEPKGPPLYWHQDWMRWDDPLSMSPWPQTIFFNYYLKDTSVENGCLKVIPGTHRRRIPLHDQLVPAHEQGARTIAEDHPIMFSDHPDQVHVEVKAGSLVLGDARVLHAAGRNHTGERRTLVLAWHNRPATTPPEYWEGELPEPLARRDPDAEYEMSRIPTEFLQP